MYTIVCGKHSFAVKWMKNDLIWNVYQVYDKCYVYTMLMQFTVLAVKAQSMLLRPSYAISKILGYSTQIQPNEDVEKAILPPGKGM